MALLTLLFGHRCMHRVIKNIALVGSMGIMTGTAIAVVNLVIHVSSGKYRPVGFMTRGAQGSSFIFQ